jgi:hypothetical protein
MYLSSVGNYYWSWKRQMTWGSTWWATITLWVSWDTVFATRQATTADSLVETDERMRITSTGNVWIWVTNPDAKLEINNTTTEFPALHIKWENWWTDTIWKWPWILLDNVGSWNYPKTAWITYQASNSDNWYTYNSGTDYAYVKFSRTNDPANNATQMEFWVQAWSGDASTAMTISPTGNVWIWTDKPASLLHLQSSWTSSDATIRINWTNSVGWTSAITEISATQDNTNDAASSSMVFKTRNLSDWITEKIRITSTGNVLFGKTSSSTSIKWAMIWADSAGAYLNLGYTWTASKKTIKFFRWTDGSLWEVGSISTTWSSTSYNTTSDYRLKENVVPMTNAINRLNNLKPVRYNFKTDKNETVDGFLAHEVQEEVPEAVSWVKDGVDEEGNPDYQSMDYAKVTPLLTAALQEALKEIEKQQKLNNTQQEQINNLQKEIELLKNK